MATDHDDVNSLIRQMTRYDFQDSIHVRFHARSIWDGTRVYEEKGALQGQYAVSNHRPRLFFSLHPR